MARVIRLTAAAMAAGMVLALSACTSSPSNPATPSSSGKASNTPATGGPACAYPSSGKAAKPVQAPATSGVENSGTVKVTMTLGEGPIVMTFDRANAPCTVNSFVSLAQQKYFDATTCHRLVPGFVLQCGDPTAAGTGGPGYRYNDELTGKETYPRGTVAMANAGPNTNGSQFFIVLADGTGLKPQYTVLGKVADDASMAILDQIVTKDGDPAGSQKPLNPINVTSVTIG